ncbi:MAG TPA: glucuronate isomerase, partial [Clostridiaceae bacterium]|nr:glucuronate isomerase [Clostridiaceae bacterium]
LGPNTGYDAIADGNHIEPLARYLDALQSQNTMPRMILYSLNPNDNAALDTLAGCFREGDGASYISHGAAWWFNDHEQGMRDHLLSLSSQSYLPAFMGMLTDSRSLLSYSRHEYFRRIFCDVLGGWVDDGRMTSDPVILKDIVARVCYRNSASLFASKN